MKAKGNGIKSQGRDATDSCHSGSGVGLFWQRASTHIMDCMPSFCTIKAFGSKPLIHSLIWFRDINHTTLGSLSQHQAKCWTTEVFGKHTRSCDSTTDTIPQWMRNLMGDARRDHDGGLNTTTFPPEHSHSKCPRTRTVKEPAAKGKMVSLYCHIHGLLWN